ncbi:class I SAM-dependent methyltransferase [Anaerosporobacter faecicola]|uniref:class I SAM-dependent methyltransferase n=1 Tax=Anaerosporobacter faecicola TaxID=2718714 RepID=UPI0014395027|nr:class I SAM-dependent methyltransferase [Anaerosporobacter faecicola]
MTNIDEYRKIQEDAIQRYSERYKRLGVVPQALGWGKKEDQIERFDTLIKNIDFTNKRILDIGCGFADFYVYLKDHDINCKYIGIDIIPDFIEYCKNKFPECEFYQKNVLLDTDSISNADIVLSLGTLNFKLHNINNLDYTKEFMKKSFSLANETLILDFLSTKLTKTYPKEDLVYYHSPNTIMDMAFELTDNLQLVHNYKPIPQKEFMIFLGK